MFNKRVLVNIRRILGLIIGEFIVFFGLYEIFIEKECVLGYILDKFLKINIL